MAALLALFASSAEDSGGWGFLAIAGTLLVVVLVIAAIWLLAARRGSRMSEPSPHRSDHGVRGT